MKLFAKIEFHDYMDMYPFTETYEFEGATEDEIKEKIHKYVEHMKKNWSGGTTRLLSVSCSL